jgi:hypothetical protein
MLLLAGAGILLAWMVGKDALVRAFSQGKPAAQAASVAEGERGFWFRPETPPPGAWEAEWGVDVFLLLPDRGGDMAGKPFAQLAGELGAIAPVYAPQWAVGASADADAALSAYLRDHNRGRGVLFVALAEASDALPALAQRAAAERDLGVRVAGYVALLAPGEAELAGVPEGACSPGVGEAGCVLSLRYEPHLPLSRFVTPNAPQRALPRAGGFWPKGSERALRERLSSVTGWLAEFGPKPAPPLPPLEEIVDVPVYSVGGDVVGGEAAPEGGDAERPG